MIESAHPGTGTPMAGAPVDPTREAEAARAVLPHVQPGMAVLDLCCGAGWSTVLLAARVGAGAARPVIAWDADPTARAEAQQNISRASFASRAQVVDPTTCGGSFDLIYASQRAFASSEPEAAVQTIAAYGNSALKANGSLAIEVPRQSIAKSIAALHRAGFVPMLAGGQHPVLTTDDLVPHPADVVLVAQRAVDRLGFAVQTHTDQADLLRAYGCGNPGVLLEDDLDTIDNDCELHGRKRRDAEVLCGLAASHPGPCLDLGTSHGRSAFKLATNIGASKVTTVNMLPEQAIAAGVHITHVLSRDEIGSYPRERGVTNIHQLYANTLDWDWAGVPDGLHLAFVDACHDEEAVLQDSLQAWHRLDPGGFLIWHDFSPALQKVHPWIDSSMAGVRRFLEQVQPVGQVQHLLGSWCGVLQKEVRDV